MGLATGTGEMAFASAMVASIGKEGVNIGAQSSSTHSKVANIVFVCEYLLGMPVVSAIVVSADATDVTQSFNAGPCFREQSNKRTMKLHKDTYMFVTPTFIKQYAGDLNSGMNDPAFLDLINSLQLLVARTPTINGVYDLTDDQDTPKRIQAGEPLIEGRNYSLYGEFLGDDTGKLAFSPDGSNATITPGTWGSNGIGFTVGYTEVKPTSATFSIQATLSDKKTVVSTSGGYIIEKAVPPKKSALPKKST